MRTGCQILNSWLYCTTPTKQMGLEERHRRPLVYNTGQQTSVLTPMFTLAEVEIAWGVCFFIHAAQVQRLGKWDWENSWQIVLETNVKKIFSGNFRVTCRLSLANPSFPYPWSWSHTYSVLSSFEEVSRVVRMRFHKDADDVLGTFVWRIQLQM